MIWVWIATVEWYWQGKTEELGEKPVPVPLCPPQIPHGLTRARIRSSAVRGRRLTTWAMVRPYIDLGPWRLHNGGYSYYPSCSLLFYEKNFGWMYVWELNPEGWDRFGCRPLWLMGGSSWLRASMIEGGGTYSFFSYTLAFRSHLRKITENLSRSRRLALDTSRWLDFAAFLGAASTALHSISPPRLPVLSLKTAR
jgi:hypothetical protein